MKSLFLFIFCFSILSPALAEIPSFHEEAIIRSIDDIDAEVDRNLIEVSEEGFPQEHYLLLLQKMIHFRFTMMSESKVNEVFETLKKNPQARMKRPGGLCSTRRAYIQNYLKKNELR